MYKIALLLCAVVASVYGHGRLMQPPSRSSMWRFGYDTPKNYNDNELFCGGFTHQYSSEGGKCGICGDPWDAPVPRPNELGGTYGVGQIAKTSYYKSGQVIDVSVDITTSHLGYMQFSICPLPNFPKEDGTQECLDQHILQLADGSGTKYSPVNEKRTYNMKFKLPDGFKCEHCVFQWHYHTGNNWGDCGDGTQKEGCGPQETFRGCADIVIS